MAPRIVVVTEGGPHIWGLVNAITAQLSRPTVIVEQPESKWALLKRRARRQGWLSVLGQIGTMVVVRSSKVLYARQMAVRTAASGFDTTPPPADAVIEVPYAGSPEFLAALQRLKPDVVLLASCRMLKADALAAIPCPVLNYHPGITPKYRGMNSGYWALATGDPENFGSTVMLVDAGVDTGGVLSQVRGQPAKGDTIATHALTQAAFSRDTVVATLENVLAGKLDTIDPGLPSKQWYHPTIWFYLWTGLTHGIW